MPHFPNYNNLLGPNSALGADYVICYQDVSSDPYYYAYVNDKGNWLIMEQNLSNGTYKYARGNKNIDHAWALRTTLTYTIFSELFT